MKAKILSALHYVNDAGDHVFHQVIGEIVEIEDKFAKLFGANTLEAVPVKAKPFKLTEPPKDNKPPALDPAAPPLLNGKPEEPKK